MTLKSNLIKEKNLETVRALMRQGHDFTKPQISEATGLSVVTINALIKSLEALGEVKLSSVQASDGGRPAQSYSYQLDFKLALAVNLNEVKGVDTAHFKVINLIGDVIASQSVSLPHIELTSFDFVIEGLLKRHPSIAAICFGVPGGEVDGKMVVSDYPELRGKSLSSHLRERFLLDVHIENDVNVAILGYCKRTALKADGIACAIYFPEKYPPGAGYYLEGRILKGYRGLAGEIKDLPIGINWDQPLTDEDFQTAIMKLVQTFAYMLNPEHIVLYGVRLKPEMLSPLKSWFSGPMASDITPICHIEPAFLPDFESGLIIKTLSLIV